MAYIGTPPANKLVTSSDMEDGIVTTSKIADDAATADKIANAVNSAITANTSKTTNATHTGEVTGSGALTIAGNVVDEANLKVSNSPTNGYNLVARSGNTGGMTWEEAGGGGITSASQFRLTSNFSSDATPIASNWEEVDTDGYGRLGTAVSQSSGIFTFPETGIWHITSVMTCIAASSAAVTYFLNKIQTTSNNSSYADAAVSYNSPNTGGAYETNSANFILDVTNTSNIKVRISTNSNEQQTVTMGDSDRNRTYVTFIRLGDT